MTSPHDAPTAAELLESVREWLERDVLGAVDGRLGFHTRVAINVLDIVLREMELGGEQQSRHSGVLASLGFDDDAGLASAIRSGSLDGRIGELLDRLRPVIEDKVRVANPRYLR